MEHLSEEDVSSVLSTIAKLSCSKFNTFGMRRWRERKRQRNVWRALILPRFGEWVQAGNRHCGCLCVVLTTPAVCIQWNRLCLYSWCLRAWRCHLLRHCQKHPLINTISCVSPCFKFLQACTMITWELVVTSFGKKPSQELLSGLQCSLRSHPTCPFTYKYFTRTHLALCSLQSDEGTTYWNYEILCQYVFSSHQIWSIRSRSSFREEDESPG